MTISDQDGVQPVAKRYFWRRDFAFFLDLLLIAAIAGLLMIPVSALFGVDLGASNLIKRSTCVPAPQNWPIFQEIQKEWPLQPGQTRTNEHCHISIWGVQEYDLFFTRTMWSSKQEGNSAAVTYSSNRSMGIMVDKAGNPISLAAYPDFSILLMLAIFAFFTANGRRSPGKAMLGLRVTTLTGEPFGWPKAIVREGLKLLPFLGFFFIQLYQWLMMVFRPVSIADMIKIVTSDQFFVGLFAWPLFALIWWFGPFLIWRGQTWYDWLASTKVIGPVEMQAQT
jgi:uncharacterized RDD family membrane protein YckC